MCNIGNGHSCGSHKNSEPAVTTCVEPTQRTIVVPCKNAGIYTCNLCQKKFPSKIGLHQHHHYIHKQTTTYNCKFCETQEYTKASLLRHMRSCDAFMRFYNNEIKKVEVNNTNTTINCGTITCYDDATNVEVVKPLLFNITDIEKRYVCPECGHTFKQKGNMDTHRMHKHSVVKPATRQTRHKLRVKYATTRYTIKELNIKRRARFVVCDSKQQNKLLTDEYGDNVTLSQSQCKKYVDNCNIIDGLLYVFEMVNCKETHHDIHSTWTSFKEAILDFASDRPKQHQMIVDIIKNHVDY